MIVLANLQVNWYALCRTVRIAVFCLRCQFGSAKPQLLSRYCGMSLSERLFRLLQSVASDQMESFEKLFDQEGRTLDEKLAEWERHYSTPGDSASQRREENFTGCDTDFRHRESKDAAPYPPHVVDDLQLFGLTPPSSLQEVKKARNSEIKTYHPDHFHSDLAKRETAKKILQIYNSAYQRLSRYYASRNTRGHVD